MSILAAESPVGGGGGAFLWPDAVGDGTADVTYPGHLP